MKTSRSTFLLAVLVAAGAVADENRIVLRVNERIATLYEYRNRYAEQLAVLRAQDITPERRAELLGQVGERVFRQIFEELLVLSRADQLGIEVTEREIEDAVAIMREAAGVESEEEFEAALLQSRTTREGLRLQTRNRLLVQKVMGQEVLSQLQLEEEDLRRYYQAHLEEFSTPRASRLREVVVLEESGLPAERRLSLAEEIRQALLAGADPMAVVEPHRAAGATTGLIDLGWVESGDLDPELEGAVRDLEAGGVSSPVEGRGGLHVVEVLEIREASVRSFADARDEIEERESQRKFEEAVQEMLAELEAGSYIVANPPPEAAGFRAAPAGPAGPLQPVAPPEQGEPAAVDPSTG